MFIILKKNQGHEEIINILFENEISNVLVWINTYIDSEISSLKYKPIEKHILNVTYNLEIDSENNEFILKKNATKCIKGILYNTTEKHEELVYKLKIMKYDNKNHQKTSQLWKNINTEVNFRLLKKVDKNTLFYIIDSINKELIKKETWDTNELIILQNDILQKNIYRKFADYYFQKQKLD